MSRRGGGGPPTAALPVTLALAAALAGDCESETERPMSPKIRTARCPTGGMPVTLWREDREKDEEGRREEAEREEACKGTGGVLACAVRGTSEGEGEGRPGSAGSAGRMGVHMAPEADADIIPPPDATGVMALAGAGAGEAAMAGLLALPL